MAEADWQFEVKFGWWSVRLIWLVCGVILRHSVGQNKRANE